jgi:hypothetical protein
MARKRRATVADVHRIARSLPHVTAYDENAERKVYQVGGKSFVFFRNPRPDAFDPDTGERYTDVIVFWVGSEADKLALVQDPDLPFFTTPHFNGHRSVLVRASQLGQIDVDELTEVIEEAWMSQASKRRVDAFLASRG